MITITASVTFDNGENAICGEMICAAPDYRGYIHGEFRYHPDFLSHHLAFPLDPVSLPLKETVFEAARPSGVFGVFEDSLPDDWGRRLLVKKKQLPRNRQTVPELLLAIANNGLGALTYGKLKGGIFSEETASVYKLNELLESAEKFEAGDYENDDIIEELMKAGSSPGGARPKVIVKDSQGSQWIAKFPSSRDTFSMVPIEFASMRLAEKAGITIPEIHTEICGSRKVLLVRRFDITDSGGRNHMISFQSLLKAENWYNFSYKDLAEVVRKYSVQPKTDLEMLYRQMVFNAYIGNTDDHLKNFMMIHKKNGYSLSPAYDLLPDITDSRSHVLNFDLDPTFPGRDILLKLGKKSFGLSLAECIHDEVLETVMDWKDLFEESGVPENEIKRIKRSIDRRLQI